MRLAILAAASPGEVQVAVVRGQALVDFAIDRPGAPDGVGDLHRGRISARMPVLAGAFVALAGEAGFLPDSEGGKGLPEGTMLGVKVTRAAQGGKGPRLTARLTPAEQADVGAGPPALLRRGPGAVERFAGLYPEAAVRTDDPALAARLRPRLGDRIQTAARVLSDGVAGAIAALTEPVAGLPGGGRLHIAPTPALIAIDVDTGGASAARGGKSAGQLDFNRAILPELARQIRLRNLSGAIIVDLAGLSARRRAALGPALAAALAGDPLRPRFLGFTALGLAEIVRPRVHPPLHERLAGPHAAGLTALRAAMEGSAANPAETLALRAAPAVVAALQADPVALPDLARRAGRPLMLRSDPALAATGWVLETI